MKLFLSWSGELSHQVAQVLRDWLPSVIQNIEPYVSSEDIDKGTRWSSDVSQELEASNFGILCVTRDNLNAPWLNFEAGALSKSLDKSRVSPFLLGIKRAEVRGPILQFQSTIYEKEDVKRLISTINRAEGDTFVEEVRLEKAFNMWWPQLQESMDVLQEQAEKVTEAIPSTPKISNNEILEEILELVRHQQKILTDPASLLPPSYLRRHLRFPGGELDLTPIYLDMENRITHIKSAIDNVSENEHIPRELIKESLEALETHLRLLMRKSARQLDIFDTWTSFIGRSRGREE